MMICVVLGPEADGSHFEQARVAFQKGSGAAAATELLERGHIEEKPQMDHVENVEKASTAV
jgi:SHS family lactate transporter-like MFS transporter